MISVFNSFTSIGTLIGSVIDNATHDFEGRRAYLIPLGTIYIIPVLMSIGLFFIPESPRWLLYTERNEQARNSLMWLRPCKEGVEEEMDSIQAAILAEKESAQSVGIVDVWRNPIDRRRLFLSVAAVSIQAASGAMYMICKYCVVLAVSE
jgi:MFS transporter, SP family, sugar:H+ symporter